MLLSVGVVLHNNHSNLDSLMKSLLSQTDRNFSIIVLDNDSSDSSFDLVKRFESEFMKQGISFRAERNSRNLGELVALHQLGELCRTSFITVVHGDDSLGSRFVEHYNSLLSRDKRLELTNTVLRTSVDGHLTGVALSPMWTGFYFIDRLLICFGNPGLMPGSLFSTSILREISRPVEGRALLFNADSLLWFRYLQRGGRISCVDNSDYVYVRSNQQSSSSPLNDDMMAMTRFIRIKESETRIQRYLVRAGVEFDRHFVNYDRYIVSLKSLLPNLEVPRAAKFLNKIYSVCTRFQVVRKTK